MILIDLDAAERAHLRRALAAHQVWCRCNGIAFPESLRPLVDRSSQERPRVGEALDLDDAPDVTSGAEAMMTYAEAGVQLRLSARSVRRRVADGELRAVSIGGARRIRRDDLDEYLRRIT